MRFLIKKIILVLSMFAINAYADFEINHDVIEYTVDELMYYTTQSEETDDVINLGDLVVIHLGKS